MTAEPLLTVADLTVDYGRRRSTRALRALDGVSLEVLPGEVVGLVGESGSGKSTIARAILGLAPVAAGRITFAGKDITHASFRERRILAADLQAVFQDPTSSLNPSRTIGNTLAEPLLAQHRRPRAEVRERVATMLDRIGLAADAADRYPGQFSGGQRQRISIARALMLSPKLVICDEVVSALDLSVQAQILNLLRDLQDDDGLSYLFISHDLQVVRHLCDRTVVLYRGRVVESGPSAVVSSRRAHPYTDALHLAAPVPDPRVQRARREAMPESAAADTAAAPAGGCVYSTRCGYAIDRCRTENPPLRDVGDVRVACHRYPEWLTEKTGRHTPPADQTPAVHSGSAHEAT
ncbi:MAG TPA: ABC transporter ATP-binding protein [Pseudonocardiaceae bacterium]|jgi:peptide/nickel transport system ATP-binding protein|nr:ABC transporter ATP-binding protein [Pseudonocardiaceae bacterium]